MVKPLSVALPKGRLLGASAQVLRRYGVPVDGKLKYSLRRRDERLLFCLLRMQDIPGLVGRGTFDLGVAPDEWIAESGCNLRRLRKLGWYRVRLCLLRHADSGVAVDPTGKAESGTFTVVTEYPSIAASYLARFGGHPRIIHVRGSSEALLPEFADFALEVVETGATVRQHRLEIVEEVLECNVHLVANPHLEPAVTASSAVRHLASICQLCEDQENMDHAAR